jgi:selenide,water dikinase
MLTNRGARAGELLVLTKPLGTGVIATALKAGKAPEAAVATATRQMATLNRAAAAGAVRHGVSAATDITGFGLIGHAWNIARESGVSLELDLSELPLLPGARELALGFQPGGLKANRTAFEPRVRDLAAADDALRALLFDPQTSGGLLLAVPAEQAKSLLEELPETRVIGRVLALGEAPLLLR